MGIKTDKELLGVRKVAEGLLKDVCPKDRDRWWRNVYDRVPCVLTREERARLVILRREESDGEVIIKELNSREESSEVPKEVKVASKVQKKANSKSFRSRKAVKRTLV